MARALIGALMGAVVGGLVGCLPGLALVIDIAFLRTGNYDEMAGVAVVALFTICVPPAALFGAAVGAVVASVRKGDSKSD